MKLVSWNVNGLRACLKKGFAESAASLDADVICLQEIKMSPEHYMEVLPGYEAIFNSAEKKGYSARACFPACRCSRTRLASAWMNTTTRAASSPVNLRISTSSAATPPNSQNELRRLDYRMRWEDDFRAYLKKLDEKKPVVLCGDLNVAHEEIDLKNPRTNHFNAGFTDQERGKFFRTAGRGVYRHLPLLLPGQDRRVQLVEPTSAARAAATRGWRIDYFVVSQRLQDRLVSAAIHDQIMGSDIARWNWYSNRRNWTDFIALEVPA